MAYKNELIDYVRPHIQQPVAGMERFSKGKFSDLVQLFGSTNLAMLPEDPRYQTLISQGMILGYGEERNYNGISYGHHWGIDVLSPAGTLVQAALDGTVVDCYSFGNLQPDFGGRTYGNHLVTQKMYRGRAFFTLYGHLADLQRRFKPGDSVKQGQELGVIGPGFTRENGGWPPHLHFQVATAVVGLSAYAGLELEKITVNPEEILGIY